MVNKFGKQEAGGKGLVPVIAEALDRGIPVLVGVNALNLPPFLDFAAGIAEPLAPETAAVTGWCLASIGRG